MKSTEMRVYVNDRPVDLAPGMSVRHALIGLDFLDELKKGKKVYDAGGHEIGLDGALTDQERIYVR